MAAHQAPPSLEFSRQEYWSGLPFPSPMLACRLSHLSSVQLCATLRTAAHKLLCPQDSPGKNTGVGCHFLLQCRKAKSESEVAQLCPTLHDPMDCSLPGSSARGIFQARVLEWVAIAFSKIRDTKGTFHAKMGLIKDRNGRDLTEAEDIKEVARIHRRTVQERSSQSR